MAVVVAAGRALRARAPAADPHPPAAGGPDAAGRGRFSDRDGDPVSSVVRSLARLLRDRYPCLRPADRRGPGHGLAEPCADHARWGPRPEHPGRRRRLRPAGHRVSDLAHQPVLGLAVSGRHRAAVGGHRGGPGRARASGHPIGTGPGLGPAALDRRALVRHLSVADADHHPHHSRGQPRGAAAAGRVAGDRDPGGLGAVLALRRGADPPRGAGPALPAGSGGAMAAQPGAQAHPDHRRGGGGRLPAGDRQSGRGQRPEPGPLARGRDRGPARGVRRAARPRRPATRRPRPRPPGPPRAAPRPIRPPTIRRLTPTTRRPAAPARPARRRPLAPTPARCSACRTVEA